ASPPTRSSRRSRPSSPTRRTQAVVRGSPNRRRPPPDIPTEHSHIHSWRRTMSVSDKTALVTGAGSKRGIGRATAHTLAAAGWNIAILDLDEASAKDAAHEIEEEHGVQAVGVGCDITDETSVDNALTVLDGALSPVGAVVNNAGI